jgi:hypothetical protein
MIRLSAASPAGSPAPGVRCAPSKHGRLDKLVQFGKFAVPHHTDTSHVANQSRSPALRLVTSLLIWTVSVLLMVDADLFSGLASRLNGFIYVDDYWIG